MLKYKPLLMNLPALLQSKVLVPIHITRLKSKDLPIEELYRRFFMLSFYGKESY